jgi:hypothetical protein
MLQQMLKPSGRRDTGSTDWAASRQIFSKEYNIATWGILGSDEIEPYLAAFHSESRGMSLNMPMKKWTNCFSLCA